jgi:hypothetical protein
LFGGETKRIDGSDAKDPRIAYVASSKETPGGNACAWFLPLPVPLPNNCMLQTSRSIHAYYSLIIASRNRFISLRKYYFYSKHPVLHPHNFFQENHQYI